MDRHSEDREYLRKQGGFTLNLSKLWERIHYALIRWGRRKRLKARRRPLP